MVTLRKFPIVLACSLSLGLATSCTSAKKKGGESGGKQEEEEPSEKTNTGNSNNNTGTESPCLRLDDTNSNSDTSTDDFGDETGSSSSSSIGTGSSTSSDSSQSVSGCGDSNTDTSSNTGSSGGGSYDVGPGIDGCKEQGAVWIAVKAVDGTKKGACGDPLADFCCTEDNIYALFPGMQSQLKAKFDGYTGDGFKLYGCSASGGKYSFHFGKGDSGAQYKSAYITGVTPKTGVTPPATCPVVKLEDMGFNTSTDTDTDTDSGTDSNTDTGTGTTADIPASIGPLTDTSDDGLFNFLNDHSRYQGTGWKKKQFGTFTSTAQSGVHKGVRVQVWYNSTILTANKNWVDGTTKKFPVGSVAIMELYKEATGTDLKGWAVLAKGKDNETKESWLMTAFTGTPSGYDDGKYEPKAMGPAACSDCHSSGDRDYVKTYSSMPQP